MLSKDGTIATNVINTVPNCLLQGSNLTQSWGKCSQVIWQYMLRTSHSRRENMENTAPTFDCLFKQMQALNPHYWLHLALFTLLKCLLSGPNLAKTWGIYPQEAWQHSSRSAQVIVIGEICRVLDVNFDCLFWPIKCMHPNIQNQDFRYTLAIVWLLKCLL